MRRDLIAVAEAGYRLDLADSEWLAGVLEAARPLLDGGLGVLGWTFERQGKVRTPPQCLGCVPQFGAAVEQSHAIVAEEMRRAYLHPQLFSSLHRLLGGPGLPAFPEVVELMKMGGVADFTS